jgi:hypothetical protein
MNYRLTLGNMFLSLRIRFVLQPIRRGSMPQTLGSYFALGQPVENQVRSESAMLAP